MPGAPNFGTVQSCLQDLLNSTDDGDLHPGEIGGDVLEFDLSIENTSPAGVVLTAFGFQSKFSESPALGSRIGDKLFEAVRVTPGSENLPLGGVKKNGTSNGLFDGKRKFICVNSSTDYPAALNAGTEHETLECAGGRIFTHVDQTGTRGRGTFTYRVCEAGSTTVCSEDATATFN